MPDTMQTLRRILAAILLFGTLGTCVELWLLEHDEELLQFIPLLVLGLAAVLVLLVSLRPSTASVRILQVVMVACIASGIAGVVLHFRANMEFQLEMDPSLPRDELFLKVMRAKAPPALAPGVLVQLGLIGLAFSYRHPTAEASRQKTKGSVR